MGWKVNRIKKGFKPETRYAYLLILPAIIIIFSLILYPLVTSAYLSVHKKDLKLEPTIGTPFIGFGNFMNILSDPYFGQSLMRTFYFAFVSVGAEMLIGLGIALVFFRQFRGKSVARTTALIPYVIPYVVVGIIWKWIANPTYGALNGILYQTGIISSYQGWLAPDPFVALNMVAIADIWRTTPFVMIILLAALSQIPTDLFEASRIDGAGSWNRFRYVILPLLRPAIAIVLLFRLMYTFQAFDLIYMMTLGGPMLGTDVVTFYTYRQTFKGLQFGMGAALSWTIAIFILIFSLVLIKFLYKETRY